MKKSFTLTIFYFLFLSLNAQNFSPLDYNPALWLDAADSASIIQTSGVVSSWQDISGNANHATQSTAANQPTFTNTTDGVYFDGDDALIGTNLGYGADETITVFILAEPDAGAAKGSVIAKGQWTSGNDYRIELGENGYDICVQNGRRWNSSSNNWHINHKNLIHTYYDTSQYVGFYYNGARDQLPIKDTTYTYNNNPFSIGARFNLSNFFKGKVYEVLVFQEKLSRCQITQIEGYLFHKWGMESYIISNHTFKNNAVGICESIPTYVDENSPNGTIIDTLEGMTTSTPTTFTDWRIEDEGYYTGVFELNSSGILSVLDNTNLDYEKLSSFFLEVSAMANGSRVYGGVTVNMNDLADGDTPKTHSELWGVNGEKWDPRGRLPDFSYAGYKSGESDYEYPTQIVDVTSFGAIVNDTLSDVAAINKAIASVDSGIIYFPAGEYIIDSVITITKSNIVLRGAGNNATTGTKFYFPNSGTDLGISGNLATGDAGFMIYFKGINAGAQKDIIENTKMGDRSVTLANVSGLQVGDYVSLKYTGTHPVDGELWNHILNDQNQQWPCSVGWSNGNGGLDMYHTIERIDGKVVTLKEPIRLDIKTSWTPRLQKRTDHYLFNCGVEDIYMEHHYIVQPAHLTEPGYNSVAFDRTFNSWINNVTIKNADNGILFKASGFGEMKNITYEGRGGHHGWKFAYSSHCLADSIHFNNYDFWIHSFTLTHKANGNVVSNITGVTGIPISTDFHRNTPWETLIVNVDNDWNYNSSGVWCAGPNAGKRTVYWNMGGAGFNSYPSWDEFQTTLIGNMKIPEQFHPEKGWHENVPNISPGNLYVAQLNRRLNLAGDPLFQTDNFIGNRVNWWERDPSRWQIKNVNGNETYQLFFSETPELSGNRLGEYSILDSIFIGDHFISVDARSLEKLNINDSADLALVINYQDDNNYYYLKISSDLNQSALYITENGIATLLSLIEINITDNDFHNYSIKRAGDSLIVYQDLTKIHSLYDITFSNGKIGIGSFNDAAEFDNIMIGNILLPIELLSFDAKNINNKHIQLDWSTGTESNNDYFSIERSKDARNWKQLSKVKGAHNSNTLLHYSTIDSNPLVGRSYYRLKQINLDGRFTYSQIRSVYITPSDEAVLIYPNPTNDIVFIEGDKEELSNMEVYNLLGQKIENVDIIQLNFNKYQIDITYFLDGIYFIKTKTTVKKIYKL